MKRTTLALLVLALTACNFGSGSIPTVGEIENSPGAVRLGGYTFAEDPRPPGGECEHPGDPSIYHNTYYYNAWAVYDGEVVLANYSWVCDGEWELRGFFPTDDSMACDWLEETGRDPLVVPDPEGYAARCEALGY